ncbi:MULTISPECIES: hypothetical protein [unclassified Micromonospora]
MRRDPGLASGRLSSSRVDLVGGIGIAPGELAGLIGLTELTVHS